MKEVIKIADNYLSKIVKTVGEIDTEQVSEIISIIEKKYHSNKQIFVIGNGGSSATASHMVCDLNKTVLGKNPSNSKNKRFKAFCLSDNTPSITAIGNDLSYEYIFSEQLKNYANEGDLLIVISGSGNSKNVITAIKTADDLRVQTIGFLGFDGGKALEAVDNYVLIESADFGIIEDCHSILMHLITDYFKKTIKDES